MLKVTGWFQPLAKELVEMRYLSETPVILDDSNLLRKLPHPRKTLQCMRANPITSRS